MSLEASCHSNPMLLTIMLRCPPLRTPYEVPTDERITQPAKLPSSKATDSHPYPEFSALQRGGQIQLLPVLQSSSTEASCAHLWLMALSHRQS